MCDEKQTGLLRDIHYPALTMPGISLGLGERARLTEWKQTPNFGTLHETSNRPNINRRGYPFSCDYLCSRNSVRSKGAVSPINASLHFRSLDGERALYLVRFVSAVIP
jgi:hypothetical protein